MILNAPPLPARALRTLPEGQETFVELVRRLDAWMAESCRQIGVPVSPGRRLRLMRLKQRFEQCPAEAPPAVRARYRRTARLIPEGIES